jgi:hypothetical protein
MSDALDDYDPLMHVTTDGYYVGLWFLAGPERDWLCLVSRDKEDGQFRIDYRFRYYADPKDEDPFSGRDQKNAYSAKSPGKTEDELIAIVDAIADKLVANNFSGTRLPWKVRKRRYRYLVRGDGHAVVRVLASAPFAHFKRDEAPVKKTLDGEP